MTQLVGALVSVYDAISGYPDGSRSGCQAFKSSWKTREFLENSENYLRCDNSSIKRNFVQCKTGMPSSSVSNVLGHQWLSRWLKIPRSGVQIQVENENFWKILRIT